MLLNNSNNIKLLQLDKTIIPNIPFLWYREQEIICPINNIIKQSNLYIITQKHVLNANIYICLHSLMYYVLHNNNNNIIQIPQNYNKNMNFQVKVTVLEGNLIEIPNGIKLNEFVNGTVYIHNMAFSPPGCLHFKLNSDCKKLIFNCDVVNTELNIGNQYQFVLLNDI